MNKLVQKFKKLSKNKKITVGVVTAFFIGGVVSGGLKAYATHKENQEREAIVAELTRQAEVYESLQDQIGKFYMDEKQDFLSLGFSEEKFEQLLQKKDSFYKIKEIKFKKEEDKQLEKRVAKAKKEFEEAFEVLKTKRDIQNHVNSLFQKGTALTGNKIGNKLPIVDDLDKSTIEKSFELEEDEWVKAIHNLTDVALKQVEHIEKMQDEVKKLVANKKSTRQQYDNLLKEVKQVKNEKAQKALIASLKPVDDKLKNEEKKQAEQKAKEIGGTVTTNEKGEVVVKASDGQTYTPQQVPSNAGSNINSNTGWNQSQQGGSRPQTNGGGNSGSGGQSSRPPQNNGNTGGNSGSGGGNNTGGGQAQGHGSHCNAGTYRTYAEAAAVGEREAGNPNTDVWSYTVVTVYCSHNVAVGYNLILE